MWCINHESCDKSRDPLSFIKRKSKNWSLNFLKYCSIMKKIKERRQKNSFWKNYHLKLKVIRRFDLNINYYTHWEKYARI